MWADEKKGKEIVVLDVRGLSPITDFLVVITGETEIHRETLFNHILERSEEEGVRPWHVEGGRKNRWILVDYGDVIVNIFSPTAREYFAIEALWADANLVLWKNQNGGNVER